MKMVMMPKTRVARPCESGRKKEKDRKKGRKRARKKAVNEKSRVEGGKKR